jgi:hypothetical protein
MGLRLIERTDIFPAPSPEELQFISLSFGGRLLPLQESRARFKRWILLKGFGDIHQCIRTTLERFFVYKSVERELAATPSLDLHDCQTTLSARAGRFHLPQLFAAVPTLCGESLQLQYCVESFNFARNCLEHDNGIVTARRCNSPDRLILRGRKPSLFFKKGELETVAEFGKPGPENAALMLGAEDFEIGFRIGQAFELSLSQFIDILNTCIFFRDDIKTKLSMNASV